MQKKYQEKIPLGGFRVKKSHIRRQGQTIRKEKESVVCNFTWRNAFGGTDRHWGTEAYGKGGE